MLLFVFWVKQPISSFIWIFACLSPSLPFLHQPEPSFYPSMMAFLQQMRSPRLSFIQTVVSLVLGGMALLSPYWCVGKQKVPKPLCSPTKHSNCIPVPGVSNSSSIQFSWETGDDRFVFPTFHTGLFVSCEENIYTDAWGERGRQVLNIKNTLWISVGLFSRVLKEKMWEENKFPVQSAENKTDHKGRSKAKDARFLSKGKKAQMCY